MKKKEYKDEFERRRAERQRRIRKRRTIIFFICFIIIAAAVGVALCLTVFFPIEKITASGSEVYTPEQIVSSCGLKKGDNLFAFSETELNETLRRALPYIESVAVKRSLPGSVELTVKDSSEYACFNVDGGFYVINSQGFVLNRYDSKPENILEIRASDVKCEVGSTAVYGSDKERETAESLLNSLRDSDISVDYIDVSSTVSISAKVDGRFIVDFGTSNNLDKKVAHLAGMIKSIDTGRSGKINLSMWSKERTEGTFIEEAIE